MKPSHYFHCQCSLFNSLTMTKSKKKTFKLKTVIKLTLKSVSKLTLRSLIDLSLLNSDNIKFFNCNMSININKNLFTSFFISYMLYWTLYVNKRLLSQKVKMIKTADFDYLIFLSTQYAVAYLQTKKKEYKLKRQQIKVLLFYLVNKKTDNIIINLKDKVLWNSLKNIVLTWDKLKKKNIKMFININYT